MRLFNSAAPGLVGYLLATTPARAISNDQHPIQAHNERPSIESVSASLFTSLERTARLVDITYCVGVTGISPPFTCASRCNDFPSLHLVSTWHTGVLLSDSCGYIAVDHGLARAEAGDSPHDPAIVVAFRGTYSLTNTVVDLSTVPQEYVPYPAPDDGDDDDDGSEDGGGDGSGGNQGGPKCGNCTVHMGFLASWRSARKVVLPPLKAAREKHPSYPVHLVGHSLGGAVAALAALELRLSLGWEDVFVTTFGEPRVGNRQFVTYLDGAFGLEKKDNGYGRDSNLLEEKEEERSYRRVTHVDDPVPLLPLSEWGFRSHAGEIYISKPSLQPAPEDLRLCRGDADPMCIAGAGASDGESVSKTYLKLLEGLVRGDATEGSIKDWARKFGRFPSRLKLWQLFFAHRDYFWRLGVCMPGGDPWDWGRDPYDDSDLSDEL